MFFSISPKTKRSELFDREREMNELKRATDNDRLIVLDGLRRTGKTSLLKVFLNDTENFKAFIDCRHFVRGNVIDSVEFNNALIDSIEKETKTGKFRKLLESISSMTIRDVQLSFEKSRRQRNLASVLKKLDTTLERKSVKFIVALDEAQNLRFYGKGGRDFLNLLAYTFDNLKNIIFILTGSEVGLLFDFLKLEDPDEPLYARYITEITLKRFSREESMQFLIAGLDEIGVNFNKSDLEKVITTLDGVVGYLAIFGYEVYKNGPDFETALERAGVMAKGLVKKEIDSLLARSINYGYALKAVAFGMERYSQIKKYIEANFGPIHDSTLSNILNGLVKQSFLEISFSKSMKSYSIPDPITSSFCASMNLKQ
ncbi:MAG TPA: ATP-binding protein [Mesotoga infera]|uniref:ATPase n=1 Tax=Mesotoga infera TaxID=1236046 RepID=A0A7Z7LDH4_9BACT|nr:ATP-binding protein [Mesotoga infera]HRR44356.1 ATP-binding protein [Mesotoga sp.]SSC11859.1 ATPase [Mesotoga infera]HON28364.1 ATP-binding protein [Mesotoga infera]HPD36739.1 ATP-binding protein [Mesotoga infera]HRV01737.1 ATP-binding protein [Mesotoga sp.]